MSDPAGSMSAWIDLWRQWVEAWLSALATFGQGVVKGRPIPGVNDARVRLAPLGPAAPPASSPATGSVAQGSATQGTFQATNPVDEDGHVVDLSAVTLDPLTTGPGGSQLWIRVDPPPGTPSGFYSCDVHGPDGSVAAEGVWLYLVRPD